MVPYPFLELLLVVFGAIAIDLAFGDPKNRYHPTAWAGSLIAVVVPHFAGRAFWTERLGGLAAVVVTVGVAMALIFLLYHAMAYAGSVALPAVDSPVNLMHVAAMAAFILAGCILLKCTIAIRGMQKHAYAVVDLLESNNGTAGATASLAMIVKRKTGSLDRKHIISAILESIGENTVDGVTGSLFYYGLFGLPGAFMHRIVSTADSMVGYQNDMLGRLGWFAARSDTILNYAPARITGLAMVAASAILRYDWRGAYHTMRCDHGKTASLNSGFAMAALAGALNVRLEKEGHYTLCDNGRDPSAHDVRRAITLMKVTVLVFATAVVVPSGLASATIIGVLLGGGLP